MIRYRIYKNNNKKSQYYGSYYARTSVSETIGLEKLAEHMAAHNTPYSKGCIHGVLKDMVVCIKELVVDGKAVKIDDLAIFSAGISTKPAGTAEEFIASANIKDVHLRSRATGKLRTTTLSAEVSKKEADEYSVDKTESTGV